MPSTVYDLQTALGDYVHPKLEFLDTLNRSLRTLSRKGIWKDLTFEGTIEVLSTDKFFVLPSEAESLLYANVSTTPVSIQPLWSLYSRYAATGARGGYFFGVEDAGYAPLQTVLTYEKHYAMEIAPLRHQTQSSLNEPETTLASQPTLTGNEKIRIKYIDSEGYRRDRTLTLPSSVSSKFLLAGIKRVEHLSWSGFADGDEWELRFYPLGGDTDEFGGMGSLTSDGSGNWTVSSQESTNAGWDFYASGANSDSVTIIPAEMNQLTAAQTLTASTVTSTSFAGAAGPTSVTTEMVGIIDNTKLQANSDYGQGEGKYWFVGGEIDSEDGLLRHNLFRIHASGTKVHCLFKRKHTQLKSNNEVVYLDNEDALRYAFLAIAAEYNNDHVNADKWWAKAKLELDEDLQSSLGAATPQINYDPSGGAGAVQSFQ